jgi:hypothetical protein
MALRKVWDKNKNAWVPVSNSNNVVINNTIIETKYIFRGLMTKRVRQIIRPININIKIVTVLNRGSW